MPGGGFVTNEIKLPENWNELVAPLGYEPIENFYTSGKFNKYGRLPLRVHFVGRYPLS